MDNSKPNVILIITDDQGYGDLGCHGNPVARTPCLNKLYEESVRLTDFHVAPMCTPTRGQLLTGLDAARNGAVNVSSGRSLLRADLPTMADLFRASGYRTSIFGKWHLGDNYPYRPQDRGFEESLWFPSSHISSLPDYWENDYFDDIYCRNGIQERFKGYCTEVFFNEAIAWMKGRAKANEPFFAFLPTNAPHAPLWVPPEDHKALEIVFSENEHLFPELTLPARRNIIRFLAMIRNVDTQVGLLREFLCNQGINRNTILIFMTDNGSTFGPLYFNAGMKGSKCTLWEGGHRVPCFIHWPDGDLKEPRDIGGLTQVQDILPTLIDFCGLEAQNEISSDGISLASAIRGDEPVPQERTLIINYSRIPSLDYPTPDSASILRREGAAVLWKRWRLLATNALYDLDNDPVQEVNVIDRYPEIANKMRQALDRWWEEVEPIANQVQYISIGNDRENPMTLSATEWKDVFLDQQQQVRVGERKNSYWHLLVERGGRYQFELRRWPRESGLRMIEACPATMLVDGELDEGFALPVARARILIERQMHIQPVNSSDQAAVFTLRLNAGRTLLHTWFDDVRNQPICGAYYVYIFRLES